MITIPLASYLVCKLGFIVAFIDVPRTKHELFVTSSCAVALVFSFINFICFVRFSPHRTRAQACSNASVSTEASYVQVQGESTQQRNHALALRTVQRCIHNLTRHPSCGHTDHSHFSSYQQQLLAENQQQPDEQQHHQHGHQQSEGPDLPQGFVDALAHVPCELHSALIHSARILLSRGTSDKGWTLMNVRDGVEMQRAKAPLQSSRKRGKTQHISPTQPRRATFTNPPATHQHTQPTETAHKHSLTCASGDCEHLEGLKPGCLLRETGVLAAEPAHVVDTLLDVTRRPDWDRQCRVEEVVHTFSSTADVVFYRLNASATLPLVSDRYLLCLRVRFTLAAPPSMPTTPTSSHHAVSTNNNSNNSNNNLTPTATPTAPNSVASESEAEILLNNGPPPIHVIVLAPVPSLPLPLQSGVLAHMHVGGYIVRPHSRIMFGSTRKSAAHVTRVLQLSYGGHIPAQIGDALFFKKGATIPLLRQILYRDHTTMQSLAIPASNRPRLESTNTPSMTLSLPLTLSPRSTPPTSPSPSTQRSRSHPNSAAAAAKRFSRKLYNNIVRIEEPDSDDATTLTNSEPSLTPSASNHTTPQGEITLGGQLKITWRQLTDDDAWREAILLTQPQLQPSPSPGDAMLEAVPPVATTTTTPAVAQQLVAPVSYNTINAELAHKRLQLRQSLRVLVDSFNKSESPESALIGMITRGFILDSPSDIAAFLFRTHGLSRRQVGRVLSLSGERWSAVLLEYVNLFDFGSLLLDDALRVFMKSFALPGEAQQIDRVMVRFADRFVECNPGTPLSDPDLAYLLAFSVIMLNTDLHHPRVQPTLQRMTVEQFVNNTRRTHEQLPEDMLTALYHRIASNEIKVTTDEVVSTFVDPHMQGWLQKEGGRIKVWRLRWCVLKHACLFYFKKPEDLRPHGMLALENVGVRELGNLVFEVFPVASATVKSNKLRKGSVVSGSHNHFLFRAKTDQEMRHWMFNIRSAIFVTPILSPALVQPVVDQTKARSRLDDAAPNYESSTKAL